MRFWTIWTFPTMTFVERLRRSREWLAMEIAARLPLRIRYWTAMQEIGRATATSPDVVATPCDKILKNLDRPRSIA